MTYHNIIRLFIQRMQSCLSIRKMINTVPIKRLRVKIYMIISVYLGKKL